MESLPREEAQEVDAGTPSGAPTGVRPLAVATLVFTVAVILGGAVVRATDSGAGCGESWPRCDGQLIPVSAEGATIIEFAHRLMSASLGLALLALGIVIVAGRRRRLGGTGNRSRAAAVAVVALLPVGYRTKPSLERAFGWAVAFFLGEVLIGAALVLFGWVEDDASLGRAVAVSLHLVNTFLLLGALTLVVHFASTGDTARRTRLVLHRSVLLGAAVLLVIGASGALNALADTLYPADSLLQGFRQEFGATAPLLLQVRILHPFLAVLGGGTLLFLAQSDVFRAEPVQRLRLTVLAVIGIQFVIGVVNVTLLTPLETQVLHLLLADALWIAWVLLGARSSSVAPAPAERVAAS